jgi:hypothetical protein
MTDFTVFWINKRNQGEPEFFFCQAEDANEAWRLCQRAHPGALIIGSAKVATLAKAKIAFAELLARMEEEDEHSSGFLDPRIAMALEEAIDKATEESVNDSLKPRH